MKSILLKLFLGLILLLLLAALGLYAYLHHPKFGGQPTGARQERIERSPYYRDGEFRNLDPIPPSTGNVVQGWLTMMLTKKERPAPPAPVPAVKTNIAALSPDEDVFIWLGHASYYLQSEGVRYLVDPVFSDHAAPVPFANRAFAGTTLYAAGDFPDIDYLLITHDHWDHLDYPTILALLDKVKTVITPLGVGAHLERWGIPESRIRELDWNESLALTDAVTLHALPALHYSGRLLTRNKTLWTAYALTSPQRKIYLSGDSGYGSHFRLAGDAFGGFDLAVLDSGQYNEAWRWVHMMPEDAVRAAADLRAGAVIPVHIGRFAMAYHAWDDPFVRLVRASEEQPYALILPVQGEVVPLAPLERRVSGWWEGL